MDLTFFPDVETEQDFVLRIYADEICLRTEWIVAAAKEINSILEEGRPSPSEVIRKSMDLIGHAVVILRIVDPEGIGARRAEIGRTKERVELIRKKWPDIPIEFPQGLRDVRNDYEHFDARLDQWAISSERKLYADLNIGPRIGGLGVYEDLRRFEGDTLYFWDRAVNLSEVIRWAQQVAAAVSK